jgi:hypothetical protein
MNDAPVLMGTAPKISTPSLSQRSRAHITFPKGHQYHKHDSIHDSHNLQVETATTIKTSGSRYIHQNLLKKFLKYRRRTKARSAVKLMTVVCQ